MAEAGNGGWARAATTSCASTRPAARAQRHLLGLQGLEEPHQAGVRLGDGEERHQGAS